MTISAKLAKWISVGLILLVAGHASWTAYNKKITHLAFEYENQLTKITGEENIRMVLESTDAVLVKLVHTGQPQERIGLWALWGMSSLASTLSAVQNDTNVAVIQVDARVDVAFAKSANIDHFPALLFYKYGKLSKDITDYFHFEIQPYVVKNCGPAVQEISTMKEFIRFRELNHVSLVGYFSDPNARAAFIVAARMFQPIHSYRVPFFAIVSSSSLLADIPAKSDMIISYDGDAVLIYDGPFEASEIEIFTMSIPVEAQHHDRLPRSKNTSLVPATGAILLCLATDDKPSFLAFQKSAVSFRGGVGFLYHYAKVGETIYALNIIIKSLPTGIFLTANKRGVDSIYLLSPANGTHILSSADYSNFIEGVRAGNVLPFSAKSDPVVPYNDVGVQTLVSINHDHVLAKPKQNVFVAYYSNTKNSFAWHHVSPIWDKLAAHFADMDNIEIAKLHVDTNDVKDVNMSTIPTMVFFAAGLKHRRGVEYLGDWDLELLITYVQENAVGLTPKPVPAALVSENPEPAHPLQLPEVENASDDVLADGVKEPQTRSPIIQHVEPELEQPQHQPTQPTQQPEDALKSAGISQVNQDENSPVQAVGLAPEPVAAEPAGEKREPPHPLQEVENASDDVQADGIVEEREPEQPEQPEQSEQRGQLPRAQPQAAADVSQAKPDEHVPADAAGNDEL